MISILNNLSALSAENSLSSTQTNLQNTLTQLSTGMRINSGADDPAGLSIADGMQANIAALTQSGQNATNSVGMLQTADSALSQVTSLLNRAVTLATEGANGDLTGGTSGQATALNTEYQSILSEIDQIGQTTDFNGQNVFSASALGSSASGLTSTTTLTAGSVTTITDASTGDTFTFTAQASQAAQPNANPPVAAVPASTVGDLMTAMASASNWKTSAGATAASVPTGVSASLSGNGNLEVASTAPGDSLSGSSNDTVLGSLNGINNTVTFISDGTQTGAANTTIQTAIQALSANQLGLGSTSLMTASGSSSALTAINNAINEVSAQRGAIGASVNRLTDASNVMTSQVQNLTSASNDLTNANVATTVANMTQYNILESTGMAALQQANSSQQNILKLLQQ